MVVIKRENDQSDEIKISLRLIDLTEELFKDVVKELSNNSELDIRKPENNEGLRIVIIKEVDCLSDYALLMNSVQKLKINQKHINFFIALTTSYDMSGFTLPEQVSRLHQNIGGSIDFSVINYS